MLRLCTELWLGGCRVLVSHPKKTRYIAEAKIKSDRVDSKAIAEPARRLGDAHFLLGKEPSL